MPQNKESVIFKQLVCNKKYIVGLLLTNITDLQQPQNIKVQDFQQLQKDIKLHFFSSLIVKYEPKRNKAFSLLQLFMKLLHMFPTGCGLMLVEFHTTSGFPREMDLFVTGTVLQVLFQFRLLHSVFSLIRKSSLYFEILSHCYCYCIRNKSCPCC